MKRFRYFNFSRLSLVIIVLLCCIVATFVYFYYAYQRSMHKLMQENINTLRDEYAVVIDIYAEMAEYIFTSDIDNERIKEVAARGMAASTPAAADKSRSELLDALHGKFDNMLRHNFRQLHFHDRSNHSFLRFHRPEKYGDDLTGVRYSVEYVNKNKRYIAGFEEGKIFNGYRFVFPLSYNAEHIGSVEISVSFKAVLNQINKLFKYKTQFILLKNHVYSKIDDNERANYVEWKLDADFLMDKGVGNECILAGNILPKDKERISRAIRQNINTDNAFAVKIQYNGYPDMVIFIPVINFRGDCAGYIFAVSNNRELLIQESNYLYAAVFLVMLFVSLIIFLIYSHIMNQRLSAVATFDKLTNTLRRTRIFDLVRVRIEIYKRYLRPFSLIMIDLDHFKSVNDSYGHLCGDEVLAKVASLMLESLRTTDFIGRYGGEEFLICLPETGISEATTVAERLRESVEVSEFASCGRVTISCGVMEMNDSVQNVEDFVQAVDQLLYTAKRQGRNRVVSSPIGKYKTAERGL